MIKIGEFAKLAGVSVKTLRYYHKMGLLKPAWTNRFNGYRYYQSDQLTTLNSILVLKELAFSLEEIQTILQENLSPTQLRSMLRLKKAELEHQILADQQRLDLIEARLCQMDEQGSLTKQLLINPIQKEKEEMEIKIITKPAFTVVGLEYFGKNEHDEIKAMWSKGWDRIEQEVQHTAQSPIMESFGVCGDVEDNGNFRYLAAVEVTEAKDLPEGMAKWDVPEQTYAVFPCTLDEIGKTYEYAHSTWLPENNYQRAMGPDFEFYDEAFDPEEPESILYIYIPIVK